MNVCFLMDEITAESAILDGFFCGVTPVKQCPSLLTFVFVNQLNRNEVERHHLRYLSHNMGIHFIKRFITIH